MSGFLSAGVLHSYKGHPCRIATEATVGNIFLIFNFQTENFLYKLPNENKDCCCNIQDVLPPILMYNLLRKTFTSFIYSSPKGRATTVVAPLRQPLLSDT